jgi:hypothetical protein
LTDPKTVGSKKRSPSKGLKRHCEAVENDVFDHKARNAALQNGKISPSSGTILEAIFLELKRKEQQEKNKHSFSSIISRLRVHHRSK